MKDIPFFIMSASIVVAAICAEYIPVMLIATSTATAAFSLDKLMSIKKRPARVGARTRHNGKYNSSIVYTDKSEVSR